MAKDGKKNAGRWLARLASVAAVAALAACGGGGGSPGTGTLGVSVTDAPACGYDNVWVTVEKVRVHRSGGAGDGEAGWSEVVVSPAKRIDLLNLTNGLLEDLGTTQLEAGQYSQVRLVLAANSGSDKLANAVQPTGKAEVALKTPSAQQSGLKLQTHFEVKTGEQTDLVLDFDACKSIVVAGKTGDYILKPVVSVGPRIENSIQGYVTSTLAISATGVSAQQNGVVVRSTVPDSNGLFKLAYLPQGNYDIVVTSDGHATGVVTSVPVSATGTTTVTGTATAIVLPASSMSDVTATTSVSGTGTSTTLVTDATVRALQQLTGGPKVEIASKPVDFDLGTAAMRLPAAAPVKSAYSTSGPSFVDDTAAAGQYTLEASAPGRTTVEQALDISGSSTAIMDLIFAP